jgi:large subunit ribosomal protein L17
MVGNKSAMEVLFSTVAPKFRERPGGYTRIVRLATPRLGDAGTRAILELVGTRDRVRQKSEKPAFDDEGGEKKPAKEKAGAAS